MPKIRTKYVLISIIIVAVAILLTAFFWPKESPRYTYNLQEADYLQNTECTCIGLETLDVDIPQSIWERHVCYGVYVNCHGECLKKTNKDQKRADWEKIPCEEVEEEAAIDADEEDFSKLKNNPEQLYSYCKPDEDPDFKLTKEDDLYYYYTGDKSIRGVIHQQNVNSPIKWETKINQSCKFELTKKYVSNIDIVKKDFDINEAWKNQPDCDSKDGNAYLEGEYTIHVKGFKIPKAYIQQYNPSHIRDKVYMSKFSFYVDYGKVEKVNEKSQVKCPTVLY